MEYGRTDTEKNNLVSSHEKLSSQSTDQFQIINRITVLMDAELIEK